MSNSNRKKDYWEIYLDLADVIFGVIIAASFLSFQSTLVPFKFNFTSMMLLSAYFTVVLSWIGYHKAVEDKPHKNVSRFVIDLILLYFYFYLIFTNNIKDFLGVLAAIFLLYLIWVVLRNNEYKKETQEQRRQEHFKIIRSSIFFLAFIILWGYYRTYLQGNGDEFLGGKLVDWFMLIIATSLNILYRVIWPILSKRFSSSIPSKSN